MSRTRNSAWNFAAGLTFALASAAANFLATPWLLRWLGPERLGAYRTLVDWVGSLTAFELGLGGALMAAFAVRIGRGDHAAVTRIVAAGLRAYRRVMLAQLAGGTALVVVLPYVISLDQLSVGELRAAGAVALAPVLLTPLLVFRSLAESRQRGYLNWLLLSAQVLMMTALALLAARAGWGLIGQAMALAVAQVPTLLALALDGTRAYRGVWTATPAPADRSAVWRLSWPTFAHGLTDRIGLVSDNLIVAWILGPAAVVPLFLTQQLATLAQSHLRGIGQATWAGLAELYARGDETALRARLLELTGVVSGLGLAALTTVAAYNRAFVDLWVGRDVYAGEAVTLLACLNALLWALYTLWGWALLGTGQIGRWVPFAIVSTLVNGVVSVIGTAMLGLVGPLVGTTVASVLVTSWALPRALRRAFGISPRRLWQAALSPLRWGLAFAVVLWLFATYHQPSGWLEFIAVVVPSAAGAFVLWWRMSLGRAERLEWRTRLESVLLFR